MGKASRKRRASWQKRRPAPIARPASLRSEIIRQRVKARLAETIETTAAQIKTQTADELGSSLPTRLPELWAQPPAEQAAQAAKAKAAQEATAREAAEMLPIKKKLAAAAGPPAVPLKQAVRLQNELLMNKQREMLSSPRKARKALAEEAHLLESKAGELLRMMRTGGAEPTVAA